MTRKQASNAWLMTTSKTLLYSVVGLETACVAGTNAATDVTCIRALVRFGPYIHTEYFNNSVYIVNPSYVATGSVARAGGKQQSLGNARVAELLMALQFPIPVNWFETLHQKPFWLLPSQDTFGGSSSGFDIRLAVVQQFHHILHYR